MQAVSNKEGSSVLMRSASQSHFPLLAICGLALCLLSPIASAQSADSAGLEVDVHDSNGALIQSASLSLINHDTRVTREGQTNNEGRYRFADVPVGNYTLTIKKDGFSDLV